jgi:hypothetical protein
MGGNIMKVVKKIELIYSMIFIEKIFLNPRFKLSFELSFEF